MMKIIEKRHSTTTGRTAIMLSSTTVAFYGEALRHTYVIFAENEKGWLCFKFGDEPTTHSFKLLQRSRFTTAICRPSSLDGFPNGRYDVKKEGDWYVTECGR